MMVIWNTVAEPLFYFRKGKSSSYAKKIAQEMGKGGFIKACSKRLGSQAEVFVPTLCEVGDQMSRGRRRTRLDEVIQTLKRREPFWPNLAAVSLLLSPVPPSMKAGR